MYFLMGIVYFPNFNLNITNLIFVFSFISLKTIIEMSHNFTTISPSTQGNTLLRFHFMIAYSN